MKPYVRYSTIWKNVGGGFSNPGEQKLLNVGKHKVVLSRSEKLDRYGNPVHTAFVVNKDGSTGKPYRSNGSASLVVSKALKNVGVSTKYNRSKREKR